MNKANYVNWQELFVKINTQKLLRVYIQSQVISSEVNDVNNAVWYFTIFTWNSKRRVSNMYPCRALHIVHGPQKYIFYSPSKCFNLSSGTFGVSVAGSIFWIS